jgi:hypothetical protein
MNPISWVFIEIYVSTRKNISMAMFNLEIDARLIFYISCITISLIGSFIFTIKYLEKPTTKTKFLQIICIVINFSIQIAPLISCISFLFDNESRIGVIAGSYYLVIANACLFCMNLLNNHIFSVFASIFDILNENYFKRMEIFMIGYGSLLMIAMISNYTLYLCIDGYSNKLLESLALYMSLIGTFFAVLYDNIKTITLAFLVRKRLQSGNGKLNSNIQKKYIKVILLTLMTCGLSWSGFICYGLATTRTLDFYMLAFPGVMIGNY